jgi:hypothetical protein
MCLHPCGLPFIYSSPSLWITLLSSKNRPFKATDFCEKARHEIQEGKIPFPTPVIEPSLKKKCSAAFLDLLSGLMKVKEYVFRFPYHIPHLNSGFRIHNMPVRG